MKTKSQNLKVLTKNCYVGKVKSSSTYLAKDIKNDKLKNLQLFFITKKEKA